LQLLATLGVSADDPRLDPDAITRSLQRWLRLRIWLEQLSEEQKAIQEQLRLAHLRGALRRLLPTRQPRRQRVCGGAAAGVDPPQGPQAMALQPRLPGS
jgi:hypothetical protein